MRGKTSSVDGVRIAAEFLSKLFIPSDTSSATTLGKPSRDLSKVCVPITVLLGIPGSDVAHVVELICAFSSGTNDWVHVTIDARYAALETQDARYEQDVHARIQLELRELLEFVRGNVKPRAHPRIMLSVVGYVDPITVAAAVKSVAQSTPPLQIQLSLLAACVSATNVYFPDPLEAQSPFPRLFDQMTPGFATHIVVTHSSDVSSSQLGRLRFHIDHANPFADIHVLSHDVFEGPITALLTADRFESPYVVRYRDARFPGWSSDSAWTQYVAEFDRKLLPKSLCFAIAPGIFRTRFLHFVGSTLTPFAVLSKSLEKLHQQYEPESKQSSKGIHLAQSLAAGKPNGGGVDEYGSRCWNVEARVVFASEPGVVYDYVSTSTSTRLRAESTTTLAVSGKAPGRGVESATPTLEVMVTGINLDATKVRELLLDCYAQPERGVTPLRAKNAVSLVEKREIQKAHVTDPLPEGYLYDGSTYVDFVGGRYEFHPNIAQFVDAHIAAMNEHTTQANAKAEERRQAQQTLVKQLL